MKSTLFAIALAFAAPGAGSWPTCAATPASSFGVSATVQATCMVVASSATFGTDAGGLVNATSSISVNCTHSTPYNVSLSAAPVNEGAAAVRTRAEVGSVLLRHARLSNSEGTVGRGWMVDTNAVAGTGNGSAQTLAVHSNISAERHLAAGAYIDTIAVTVIY